MLVRAGLIDEMQLNSALSHQRQWGGKLGDVLVDLGFLDEMMLWLGLSRQLNVTLVSLPELTPPAELLRLVPAETCERLEIFPILRDERSITIATSDPNNVGALDEVAFRLGLKVKTVLAPHREVVWAIRRYYRGDRSPCPPPRERRRLAPDPPAPAPPAPADERSFVAPAGAPGSFVPGIMPSMVPGMSPLPTAAQMMASSIAPSPVPSMVPQAMMAQATTLPPQPAASGAFAPPSRGLSAEEQLAQANEMLYALVEMCIQRGVFTKEELWARLNALKR